MYHKSPTEETLTCATGRIMGADVETMRALGREKKLFHFYSGSEPPEPVWVSFSYYFMSIFSSRTKDVLQICQIRHMDNLKLEGHYVKWNADEGKQMILKCYKGHLPDENLQRHDCELAETLYNYIHSLLKNMQQN